jgi:hypothetical protein
MTPLRDALASVRSIISAEVDRLEQTSTLSTVNDVKDYLDRQARSIDERRFADAITETLSERDAKLIEIERESNIRLQLLNESSQMTSLFERQVLDLQQTLEVNGQALAEYARRLQLAESKLQTIREEIISVDVFTYGDPIVLVGTGWHSYESFGEDSFRWVGDNARLNVALLTHAPYDLVLDVEPGPAVGNKPFDLVVLENGKEIATRKVIGRDKIHIPLGAGKPSVRTLELKAVTAAPPLPAPGDARVLKFRIFSIGLEVGAKDVVALAEGLVAAKGWYPIEEYAGETFRWAGPEVTIEKQPGAHVDSVVLEIEPGPGVDFGPVKLTVLAGDKAKGEVTVSGREIVEIPWPEGTNGSPVRLRVEGGGKMIPTDPRVMNFRAFIIAT